MEFPASCPWLFCRVSSAYNRIPWTHSTVSMEFQAGSWTYHRDAETVGAREEDASTRASRMLAPTAFNTCLDHLYSSRQRAACCACGPSHVCGHRLLSLYRAFMPTARRL